MVSGVNHSSSMGSATEWQLKWSFSIAMYFAREYTSVFTS